MAGQDAVNAARAFGAALDLTGVILTKADGDARGGGALSVRQITANPSYSWASVRRPEGIGAIRPGAHGVALLGMGDVISLVEQVHRQVDTQEAERLARKVVKGKASTWRTSKSQLEQLQKMGGVGALLDKLPPRLLRRPGPCRPTKGTGTCAGRLPSLIP